MSCKKCGDLGSVWEKVDNEDKLIECDECNKLKEKKEEVKEEELFV